MYFLYANHKFYGGLVAFWVYRQSHDPTWAERGRTAKVAMMKWAEWSHHNFQHRVYLLDAEDAFCNNDTERAQLLYEKAVSTARDHHFINDEALSSELAGYFFLAIDKKHKATEHFLLAHKKYHDWGAVAKCNALFDFVEIAMAQQHQQMIMGPVNSNYPGFAPVQQQQLTYRPIPFNGILYHPGGWVPVDTVGQSQQQQITRHQPHTNPSA
ncbi:hypothetical protein ACHAW5_002049 [Stephanodiscus triporus]|uniref:Uncharacterized protein n=1 Tax=Stephanodiscus triporus TaxID=2934178 RepID=A0ABD3QKC1_9STRA